VAADDGVVRVRTLRGDSVAGGTWTHDGPATAIAFGGDRALASGGRAGDVRLARASGGDATGFTPVVTLGKHERPIAQLAFNRTASVLASGDEGGTVRLWSVAGGGELCSLEGQHADYIRGLAFAPSGRTLASADEGGVAIWFVDEEQARCRFGYRLVDLESPTQALRFAADGSALVVVGGDGVIRRYARALWAPRDSLLALARRRLRGRELSPAELERYTRLR
jgi:WD40 repeat protein